MSVRSHLAVLEKAGLVELAASRPELEYLFRHGLIQDAAYSTLLRDQRRRWHQAAGEALESTLVGAGAADHAGLAPLLGHHFSIAGDAPRARRYFVQAGDAAFGRYANAEAADHYASALALVTGQDAGDDSRAAHHLYTRRGRALELTNDYFGALENYAAMQAYARSQGDRALELAALTARATVLSTASLAFDPAQAQPALEQARRLAADLGDRAAEAKIAWNLMLLNSMRGADVDERIRYAEQSLALARELDLREQMAYTLTDMFFAYGGKCQWDTALDALARARDLWQELDNPTALCEAIGRTGVIQLVRGNYDVALALSEEAYRLAQAIDRVDLQSLSRAFTGQVYMDRGEVATGLAIMEQAVADGAQTGNVTVLTGTRADLGLAYGQMGDVERGLLLAAAARALAEAHFPGLAHWARAVQVRLHLDRGDVAAAAAALDGALDFAELRRQIAYIPFQWANVGVAAGLLALARGPGATPLLERLVAELEAFDIAFLLPEARWLLGRSRLAEGHLGEAGAALRQAQREAQSLGSRRLLWPILDSLAQVEAQSGSTQAASRLRAAARAHILYIAGQVPSPELRAAFLARPAVSAVLEAPD